MPQLSHIRIDGHDFTDGGRCWNCSMRFEYYLALKSESEKQPERQDIKDWMKCNYPSKVPDLNQKETKP